MRPLFLHLSGCRIKGYFFAVFPATVFEDGIKPWACRLLWWYQSRPPMLSSDNELGLGSLINGISKFLGYSMPKPFSQKNSSGAV